MGYGIWDFIPTSSARDLRPQAPIRLAQPRKVALPAARQACPTLKPRSILFPKQQDLVEERTRSAKLRLQLASTRPAITQRFAHFPVRIGLWLERIGMQQRSCGVFNYQQRSDGSWTLETKKQPAKAYTYETALAQIKAVASLEPILKEFYKRPCHRQASARAYILRRKALTRKVAQLLPKGVSPDDLIVGYGAADFGSPRPVSPPFLNLAFQEAIRDRGIHLVLINEFNASQVQSRALLHPRDKRNRLVGPRYRYLDEAGLTRRKPQSNKVRVCPVTGRLIQREVNAARNIASVFFCLVYSGGRRRGSFCEDKVLEGLYSYPIYAEVEA
ncbi:hypothetical protein BDK51DRAFT_32569, partial [Blyttiomyces helicus]